MRRQRVYRLQQQLQQPRYYQHDKQSALMHGAYGSCIVFFTNLTSRANLLLAASVCTAYGRVTLRNMLPKPLYVCIGPYIHCQTAMLLVKQRMSNIASKQAFKRCLHVRTGTQYRYRIHVCDTCMLYRYARVNIALPRELGDASP